MKILLIHMYFSDKYYTGINPIVYGTYRTLNEQGDEVYVYAHDVKPYIDENYKYSKYFPKSVFIWDVEHTPKNVSAYRRSFIYNKEAVNNLEKLLDEIKPDLVHIHVTCCMSFGILKPIKKRKIPIVYSVHDISAFCPSVFMVGTNICNECRGYNTFPCIRKNCGKKMLRSIFSAFRNFTDRLLGSQKDIDLYLAVSEATKQYLIKSGLNQDKIKVLPNFVDKQTMEKGINTEIKSGDYFFYAGGVAEIKGLYTLLETMKSLPRDINLHLAGSGDYEKIKEFIKENNLENIKILGTLTKEQMQKEYENCISVLMPSEWFETFGMINIEAAVWGKPSVSSNIGGLSNVVENEKTGLIFEPKNKEQLKECILKYWNNRDLALQHGRAAREKVLSQYSEDIYFNRLREIYKEAIEKR